MVVIHAHASDIDESFWWSGIAQLKLEVVRGAAECGQPRASNSRGRFRKATNDIVRGAADRFRQMCRISSSTPSHGPAASTTLLVGLYLNEQTTPPQFGRLLRRFNGRTT